jgi:hypothetical protein
MSTLTPTAGVALVPPSSAMLDQLDQVREIMDACPQVPIVTEHLLHGGMYARTIRRDLDSVTVGSLINKATILIVNGPCSLLVGDQRVELTGYNVLAGLPGRKSFSWAHGPVEMTMIFATSAKTVEEAENEIFAEADRLISRRDGDRNQVTITGQ